MKFKFKKVVLKIIVMVWTKKRITGKRVSSHAKRVKTYIRDKDVPLTREKVKISENKPCCIKKQAIWHIMKIYYHYGYFSALEVIMVIVFRVQCEISYTGISKNVLHKNDCVIITSVLINHKAINFEIFFKRKRSRLLQSMVINTS